MLSQRAHKRCELERIGSDAVLDTNRDGKQKGAEDAMELSEGIELFRADGAHQGGHRGLMRVFVNDETIK